MVLNSPAYKAGVRPGDVVEAINGVSIHTRIESEALLDQCHLAREEQIELRVCRDGQQLSFTLFEPILGADTYPYNSDYFYRGENYGIFHVEDFRLVHIQMLLDLIEKHRAKNTLLFTSEIVAPIFEVIVNGIPEFKERLERFNIYIETVGENTAGGNYNLMDSRFVDDYAKVVRKRRSQGMEVDLIVIPDAFGSSWGVDMLGRSYTSLEREFGVPVRLIDWLMVYGREV